MNKKNKRNKKTGRIRGINFTITSIMIILSLLSIAICISISYILSSEILSESVNENMVESTRHQSDILTNWVEERIKDIESHSINPIIKNMNIEESIKYLKEDIKDKRDIYDVFFIADLNGDYISTRDSNNIGNVKDRDYFQAALKGQTAISNPINSQTTGGPISVVASPIKDNLGKVVGVLAGTLDLKKLSDMTQEFSSVEQERYSFIIDSEGVLLAHPNENLIMNESISKKSDEVSEGLVKASAEILSADSSQTQYSQNGTPIYAYYNEIENSSGWKIVTKLPKDVIYKPINDMLLKLILVGIGSLVVVIIVSLFIGKSLSRPIVLISKEIDRVGDLDLRREDTSKGLSKRKDEIGDIKKSTDFMKTQLIEIIKSILNISNDISDDSNRLTSSIKETSMSVEEVSKTVEEMAEATTEQARSTEEGLNRLISLANKIDQVDKNANTMKAYIDETRISTEKGSHSVKLLNVKMADNDRIAGAVAQSVVSLLQNSKSIGDISNTIGEIAEHVNLLSLNATIEAARAGEHGKGFAVVADEIRKLAHETEDSSRQIIDIVRNVQNEIEETNKGMELAGETITELRGVIDNTGVDFKNISDFVFKIVNQIEILGNDIIDITKDKEDVLKSIENISAISEQSAAGAEEISASIEEQSATLEEILKMADNFSGVTDRLNREIEKFTI